MGSFFQGWRRKIGLMTLLLALVFMSGWVRSFITGDFVTFPARNSMLNGQKGFGDVLCLSHTGWFPFR